MEIFLLQNGYHISCRTCSFLTAFNVNLHVFLGEDEGMNRTQLYILYRLQVQWDRCDQHGNLSWHYLAK
jgi:hypothetical protein